MFLTEKYFSKRLSFLPLPSKVSKDSNLLSSCRAFDDALAARLASLLPLPESSSPSLPLTWLARAVDLLALTLSDASALLSRHPAAGDSSSAILDSTTAILDACNALAARAEHFLRSCLLARFALHLLLARPDSSLPRAREILAQWDVTPSYPASAAQIQASLAPRDSPRKISASRRAVFGVEALSAVIAGASLAALSGEGGNAAGIRISGEFPWAEVFGKVEAAVAGKLGGGLAVEIEAAEAAVRKLVAAIDEEAEEDDEGEKTERLRSAVAEAEKATEEMKEGLGCLSSAVNGLFRAALAARNAALGSLRLEPEKNK